jgi:hypothetical protein
MRLFFVRLLPIALAVLSLAGCLTSERRDISLEHTLRAYETTIRWGRLENAYAFVQGADESPPKIPPGLGGVRVTDYEVIRPLAHPAKDRATQTVEIHYLFNDEQVVRRVVDQQTWAYDRKSDHWYLASPVAHFR